MGKANMQVPSGSPRSTLALLICTQVNLRNIVIDFSKFYWPAQVSISEISLFEHSRVRRNGYDFFWVHFAGCLTWLFNPASCPTLQPRPRCCRLRCHLPPKLHPTQRSVMPQSGIWSQSSNTIWAMQKAQIIVLFAPIDVTVLQRLDFLLISTLIILSTAQDGFSIFFSKVALQLWSHQSLKYSLWITIIIIIIKQLHSGHMGVLKSRGLKHIWVFWCITDDWKA